MHLFEDAFVSDLRVSHLIKLMGYHPEYLDVFLKTHQLLMKGDGPLPVNMRIYIAIMVRNPILWSRMNHIFRHTYLVIFSVLVLLTSSCTVGSHIYYVVWSCVLLTQIVVSV